MHVRNLAKLLGLSLLLLPTWSFATASDCCCVACAPCCGYWEASITGGWFGGLSDYNAYAINSDTPYTPPRGSVSKVDHGFGNGSEWGAGGYIAYHFGNTRYDLRLAYMGVFNNNNTSSVANSGQVGITSVPADWVVNYADYAKSKVKVNFNQVELSLGGTYAACDSLCLHPRLGLLYLQMQNNQHTHYTGQDFGSAVATVCDSSNFNGIGPLFALDVNQYFCGGWFLAGSLGYSPLIGSTNSRYSAYVNDDSCCPARLKMESDATMVNYIQSELGIGYCFHGSSCCKPWTGKVELGWIGNKAFGGVERGRLIDASSEALLLNSINNAAYQGPFLRLSFANI